MRVSAVLSSTLLAHRRPASTASHAMSRALPHCTVASFGSSTTSHPSLRGAAGGAGGGCVSSHLGETLLCRSGCPSGGGGRPNRGPSARGSPLSFASTTQKWKVEGNIRLALQSRSSAPDRPTSSASFAADIAASVPAGIPYESHSTGPAPWRPTKSMCQDSAASGAYSYKRAPVQPGCDECAPVEGVLQQPPLEVGAGSESHALGRRPADRLALHLHRRRVGCRVRWRSGGLLTALGLPL